MGRNGGRDEKPWWVLVGGRRRLGRELAQALAPGCSLVLTSSAPWEEEARWITELSKQTRVRCLRWSAEDPDLVPTMMADMDRLVAEGIRDIRHLKDEAELPELCRRQVDRSSPYTFVVT